MVIEPLFDKPHNITTAEQPYDGSSSSSRQQLSVYNANPNLEQNRFLIGSPEYPRSRSNDALHYISQMLMEDADERVDLHQGEAALQAAEKPFYDILRQAYQSPLNCPPVESNKEPDSPDNNYHKRICRASFSKGRSSYNMIQPLPTQLSPYSYGKSLFLQNTCGVPGLQFRRDVDKEMRFVPSIEKLVIDLDSNRLTISKLTTMAKVGENSKYGIFEATGQWNNPYIRDMDTLEGRSSKQYTLTYCEIIRNEMFDRALLCYGMQSLDEVSGFREIMAKEASKNSLKARSKGSAHRKLWAKKQPMKEIVDLRTLLIQCAQAVAANDRILASELVKKIRRHSSPDGDHTERLAFYLVDGLEARLVGIRSQVYHKLFAKRGDTEDALKAYRLYLSACPFTRASYKFANQTILDASKGQQTRVHIVDFGISYGFQWPSLIQWFADQEGGPPKLRITGIDMPRPGFCPSKKIEETGKRLADYANMFKVPFQYQGIASPWEAIQIEDLNIDKDEVVIINCMFSMDNLRDETVAMSSARDKVLKTMRMMNPKLFVLSIVNGSYSSPFFVTRFKEVMFHYSAMFDMLDANIPRDNEARKMIERGFLGRDALNIIACEGAERTKRAESYKQYQVRCIKAGFEQIPINTATLQKIIGMKKNFYHEDFFADEDSGWLLQGWKGKVLYAIATWKPNELYDDDQ